MNKVLQAALTGLVVGAGMAAGEILVARLRVQMQVQEPSADAPSRPTLVEEPEGA